MPEKVVVSRFIAIATEDQKHYVDQILNISLSHWIYWPNDLLLDVTMELNTVPCVLNKISQQTGKMRYTYHYSLKRVILYYSVLSDKCW